LNFTHIPHQLRGLAEKRQIPNVNYALQHNLGLGGAVVVAIYAKAFKDAAKANDESSKFKSNVIFKKIEETLKAEGETLVNKVKGIFAFKVKVEIF